MFWDTTYILVIIGALICAGASLNVNQTYRRYSTFANRRGITAEAAAAQILRSAGITDVRIERIRGSLTDHYSPRERVLRLSDSVYGSTSVAAIGVAAHECGHAIQHQVGYFPLKLRSLSVPVANIGSMIYWPVILLGLILGYMELAQIGVLLFGLVVAFQLITLPVEIYNYTKKPIQPKVYALFTLMFITILILMVVMNLLQAKSEKNRQQPRRARV